MSLTLDVFNSGYVPVNGGPGWESARTATWPASTATLIAGEREAILVDALMTIEEGRQLASWIGDSGKNLTNIVITHGHGDNFFGAGPVLAAFPEARLVALNTAVVDAARMHVVDPIRQNWIEWFGDEFNHQAAVPQALGSETLTVEEHPVHLIEVGVPMVHWPRCCTSRTGHRLHRRRGLQQHPHVVVELDTGEPPNLAVDHRQDCRHEPGNHHRRSQGSRCG